MGPIKSNKMDMYEEVRKEKLLRIDSDNKLVSSVDEA